MNTKQVSIKQSNGVLRNLMNTKVKTYIQSELEEDLSAFLASDIVAYEDLSQLSIREADKVLNQAINKYLASKDKSPKAMSSLLAQMGGTTFQNLRIYRDIIYTKQNRQQRLLSAMRARLYKAKANADEKRGVAYI